MPEAPAAPPPAPSTPAAAPSRPSVPGGTVPRQSAPARPARQAVYDVIGQKADAEMAEKPARKIEARQASEAAAKAPPTPAKPADAPAETPHTPPADKPAEKPAEKPAGKFVPIDDDKINTTRAGELSRNYKAMKAEYTANQAKLAALETERAQFAEWSKEKGQFTEKLTAAEKRAQEYEETLRFTNYERSAEYKEQHEKPYVTAFNAARERMASLRVLPQTNADTGEVLSEMRPGTAQDWDAVMSAGSEYDASVLAEKLFGPVQANTVMRQREKVLELNEARVKAIEDYRAKGGERAKQQAEAAKTEAANRSKFAQETWKKHFEAPLTDAKTAVWFKPIEGDIEGNKLLEEGYRETMAALQQLDPFALKTPQEREQVIARHAEIAHKAAAFNRLAYQLDKTKRDLKKAQETLKGYEQTAPSGGKPGAAKPAAQPSSTRQSLDEAFRSPKYVTQTYRR